MNDSFIADFKKNIENSRKSEAEQFKKDAYRNTESTKIELNEFQLRIDARFERIDGELKLNRWMLGIIIAGVWSLVLKTFFA